MIEEVDEFIEASNNQSDDKIKEELADVLEVINAFCKMKEYNLSEIESCRLKKKKENGGFEKRVFLFLDE